MTGLIIYKIGKAKTYENAGWFNPYDQRYVRFIEDRKYFSKTMDISQILLWIQNLRKSVDLLKKTGNLYNDK